MARLPKMVDKLRAEWQALPVEKRDEILHHIRNVHTSAIAVAKLVPQSMADSLISLAKAAAQASIMPFGPGVEGVLIEVLGAIPEFSPYVRKLLTD